jgi:hypothetical protein
MPSLNNVHPVVVSKNERSHHGSGGRRPCVVCEEALGDKPKTFTNHNGNIGMAHTSCVPDLEGKR